MSAESPADRTPDLGQCRDALTPSSPFDYSLSFSTGGQPPSRCWAPKKDPESYYYRAGRPSAPGYSPYGSPRPRDPAPRWSNSDRTSSTVVGRLFPANPEFGQHLWSLRYAPAPPSVVPPPSSNPPPPPSYAGVASRGPLADSRPPPSGVAQRPRGPRGTQRPRIDLSGTGDASRKKGGVSQRDTQGTGGPRGPLRREH